MLGLFHERVVISHAVIANAVKQSMQSEFMDRRASLAMTAGGIRYLDVRMFLPAPLRQG
jgi:hypothetical protein